MSTEKVKAEYTLDKKIVSTLQAMSQYVKKDVDVLVETALKYFIATHNDYLGHRPTEPEDGA